MRRERERGQAMVEGAIFLPIIMLLLFGLIFFDRIGLVSERAESAVRYGDMIAFRHGQAYSAAIIGDVVNEAIYHNTPDQLLDLCLSPGSAANPTSANVDAAIRAAVTQSQVVPGAAGPTAVPTVKPFWRPDQIMSPNCAPSTIDLMQSQPTGVGNLPLGVDTFRVTAGINVPSYITPIFHGVGAGASGVSTASANMAFINVAAPSTLIACVPGLSVVLTIINSAATGTLPC